jgi:crotonobetainyl-CoA:carnitine CoA-transferase CaiB-like acyl-CoA transferase
VQLAVACWDRPARARRLPCPARPAHRPVTPLARTDGTRQQFSDLARTARLASTFAFLERLLHADFSDPGDLCTHRETIATLLTAWFAQRTVTELAVAFTGTSVPWEHLPKLAGG